MSRLSFFIIDLLFYLIIIALVLFLRHGNLDLMTFYYNCQILIPLFFLVSAILWVFAYYDVVSIRREKINYKSVLIAFVISLAISSSFIYFMAHLLNIATPKTILVGIFLLYFCYAFISRNIYKKVTFTKHRVIIFGSSRPLNRLVKDMRKSLKYEILGEYQTAADIEYPENLDMVIIASKLFSQDKNAWDIISKKFLVKGVLLKTDLTLFEDIYKRISKEGIKDTMWLLRGIAARQDSHIYPIIKRVIDVLFALALLPFFFPVMFVVYFLIKYIDKIDPIFLQERLGKLEKKVYIYKFRTMKPNTEDITKVGAILRRFRIDEIPQLINILKGDISIVGPRTLYDDEYYFLNKYVPNHSVRSMIKPGLTGWAQLNFKAPPTYCTQNIDFNSKPVDEIFDAAFERLAYDVWYIKNRSFFLDLEIILKTAKRAFIKDSKFD